MGKDLRPGDFFERSQAADVVSVVMSDDDAVDIGRREAKMLHFSQYLADSSLEAGINEGEPVADKKVDIGAPDSSAEDTANLDNVRGELHFWLRPIFISQVTR